jgi:hypothetical protein
VTEPAEITFTHGKVRALRRAYNAAVRAGLEEFDFEGQTLLTAYAKYLLEWLSWHFPDA